MRFLVCPWDFKRVIENFVLTDFRISIKSFQNYQVEGLILILRRYICYENFSVKNRCYCCTFIIGYWKYMGNRLSRLFNYIQCLPSMGQKQILFLLGGYEFPGFLHRHNRRSLRSSG